MIAQLSLTLMSSNMMAYLWPQHTSILGSLCMEKDLTVEEEMYVLKFSLFCDFLFLSHAFLFIIFIHRVEQIFLVQLQVFFGEILTQKTFVLGRKPYGTNQLTLGSLKEITLCYLLHGYVFVEQALIMF